MILFLSMFFSVRTWYPDDNRTAFWYSRSTDNAAGKTDSHIRSSILKSIVHEAANGLSLLYFYHFRNISNLLSLTIIKNGRIDMYILLLHRSIFLYEKLKALYLCFSIFHFSNYCSKKLINFWLSHWGSSFTSDFKSLTSSNVRFYTKFVLNWRNLYFQYSFIDFRGIQF